MNEDITQRLHQYLDEDAVDRLKRYFLGPNLFTGRWFERLSGGGDRPEVADHFSADDLVAVSMLGVTIHPTAALRVLEDPAGEFTALLREIPTGTDLWEAPAALVAEGSAADTLWRQLKDIDEIGSVISGKLLARKRPRLIPIYDRIVRAAVGAPDNWWLALHAALQSVSLRERLTYLRSHSDIGEDISLLRVLDVAIWMAGEDDSGSR